MKGLILKDLYQCVRYYKSYIVIIILFLAASVNNDSMFFVFYPCMIAGMIPPSLLAYDERSKWDLYCGTLPVSKAQIVSAKYLIGVMAQVLILLVTGVFQTVVMTVSGTFSLSYLGSVLAMLVAVSGITSSITLPFMFKLGVEKGRMAYYFMIGIVCAGSMLAASMFEADLQTSIPMGFPIYLAALVAVGVYGFSWYLSIRFYEKREIA